MEYHNRLNSLHECAVNADEGEEMIALKGHRASVISCCWNSDGTLIASGSYDKTVKVCFVSSIC